MKIAIMQPTYIPWIGYFSLIDQVDRFVIYDDVQFSYRSWQRSNRIKGPHGIIKLSLSVDKKNSRKDIKEIQLKDEHLWKTKHLNYFREYYSKAPYYEDVLNLYLEATSEYEGKLWQLNFNIISKICEYLELCGMERFVRSSDFPVTGQKSRRLINLVKALNGTTYLSPVGSFDYINEEGLFKESDITLEYLNFEHPEYKQLYMPFTSHLSIMDLLFNYGKESLAVIRSGTKEPLSPEAMQKLIYT